MLTKDAGDRVQVMSDWMNTETTERLRLAHFRMIIPQVSKSRRRFDDRFLTEFAHFCRHRTERPSESQEANGSVFISNVL